MSVNDGNKKNEKKFIEDDVELFRAKSSKKTKIEPTLFEKISAKIDSRSKKFIATGGIVIALLLVVLIYDKVSVKMAPPKVSSGSIYEVVENNEGSYVSRNGYLYDFSIKENVTNQGNELIYVYDKDITGQESDDKSLNVYEVRKGTEQVTLVGAKGEEYTLNNVDYESLLKKYTSDDANIKYPAMSDTEFAELTFLAMASMNELDGIDTYFVNTRYCAVSGDYAVVICSPQDYDADLHGYVFGKYEGKWRVFVPEYQNIDNYQQYVNNKYGYMDIDLLLNMDINRYPKESYITDLDQLVDGMVSSGVISSQDLPKTYGVACENVTYLEFKTGLAFVGVKGENGVTAYPVVNTYEAKALFQKFNSDPPYIILKQY